MSAFFMQHKSPTLLQYLASWSVHLLTASGACLGLFTLLKIHQQHYVTALWLMGITTVIDAVDGSLARLAHVKTILPGIDGALLDNIVDYLNYVITPCFFLLVNPELLPKEPAPLIVIMVSLASAYQFCQTDAKTADHFFKGFPCYWNLIVFYMLLLHTAPWLNALVVIICSILVFIPIKYVYPSRLDFVTSSAVVKKIIHGCSVLYGISTAILLFQYPKTNTFFMLLSLSYILLYLALSGWHTWVARQKPLAL